MFGIGLILSSTGNYWPSNILVAPFTFIFRVDRSRVEAIGPEKAAAEWILRLGGSVKFQGFKHWNSDYNHLPSKALHLQAIDATGLAITSNGLEHLGKFELYVEIFY